MIQARLLGRERDGFVVYCQDGDAISKGTLVVRAGGGIMFEPELLGEGASQPVRPGSAQRGRLLTADRKPFEVFFNRGETIEAGTLVVRPGGVVLFERVLNVQVDEEESAEEDRRQARRQARREGADPREAAPAV